MATEFENSHIRLWSRMRAVDGVVGLGFGPRIRDGRVISARQPIVYLDRIERRSNVPPDVDAEFRTPKLMHRRGEPRRQRRECLTDYQWIFWGKVDQLHRAQRSAELRDAPPGRVGGDDASVQTPAPLTTSISGDVFVIHDPAGSLVTTVEQQLTLNFVEAYRVFRRQFGDDYDFLAFFIDVPSGLPDIGNASTPLFSDVSGVGRTVPDERASWGSEKLRLHSHFSWISLRTMLHEPAHLWCSYVQYRMSADGPTESMLHADFEGASDQSGLHWGRFMDDGVSCMDYDRCDWQQNQDGSFNRANRTAWETLAPRADYFGYCPLDLYLMGLVGPDDVPDWMMIPSPMPAISNSFFGPYAPAAPGAFRLGARNVIFENGPRTPDHLSSPRVFHQAAVVITKNPDPGCAYVQDIAAKLRLHVRNFRRATRGLAVIECSLLGGNYRDLYIRHTPSDDGTPSDQGVFTESPDVWIRNNPDGDANFDSHPVMPGQANWIYVRIRNRGNAPYQNVTVNLYQSSKAPLDMRYPDDWNPERQIGSADIATVPARQNGADGTVITKVQWPANLLPAAGGACSVLCEIIPLSDEPTALHAVWQNPKLAQRAVQ